MQKILVPTGAFFLSFLAVLALPISVWAADNSSTPPSTSTTTTDTSISVDASAGATSTATETKTKEPPTAEQQVKEGKHINPHDAKRMEPASNGE